MSRVLISSIMRYAISDSLILNSRTFSNGFGAITDFTGDQNLLMAPVALWLRENQPDALQNSEARERLFSFEVDILANDRCDISMDLKLTERVIVTEEDGKARIEAVPEPDAPEEFWAVKRG